MQEDTEEDREDWSSTSFWDQQIDVIIYSHWNRLDDCEERSDVKLHKFSGPCLIIIVIVYYAYNKTIEHNIQYQ